jgi:formylglycine-generating enzyme required for sulfatase activity
MRIKIAVLLQCILLFCTQSVRAVNIEMVTVGNPGNAPNKRYNLQSRPEGFGAVNYVYQIGKYEITAGQYAEFLNAVAASDRYRLYNTNMWASIYGCKIERLGSDGSYTYQVADDRKNRPVNYVSWGDSARFINWLHNGQPTGSQDLTTTEDGAYFLNGTTSGNALWVVKRELDARYFFPTEDEWYKAAYHDQNAGLAATYFDFPTGTDAWPGNDLINPDPGNNANFVFNRPTIGSPFYTTEVGEFENSESPYGTFDQGGNVWEWNEAAVNNGGRRLRGGSFQSDIEHLFASHRSYYFPPTNEHYLWGFRIAAAAPIPEPTYLALFSIAAIMLGGSRLRTRPSTANRW